MKKSLICLMVCLLTACASVSKVQTGENKLGDRFTVSIDGPWNRINAPNLGPAQIWTMEGMAIDQLLIYTGLKDGEVVHAKGRSSDSKDFVFHSKMEPNEIVALFEGMLTKDGSTFKLLKLEPQNFGGARGFHFEYSLTRKVDNVLLSGQGYGAVSKSELFAILYSAPKLKFYPQHKSSIEKMAESAHIN